MRKWHQLLSANSFIRLNEVCRKFHENKYFFPFFPMFRSMMMKEFDFYLFFLYIQFICHSIILQYSSWNANYWHLCLLMSWKYLWDSLFCKIHNFYICSHISSGKLFSIIFNNSILNQFFIFKWIKTRK